MHTHKTTPLPESFTRTTLGRRTTSLGALLHKAPAEERRTAGVEAPLSFGYQEGEGILILEPEQCAEWAQPQAQKCADVLLSQEGKKGQTGNPFPRRTRQGSLQEPRSNNNSEIGKGEE
ncbi:hypothetical protein RDI58_014882 [Solanum bulbocastanum]|uniref:Uncharacterized protein n=1 Tax=Solanum bulbocastanum TaxID=147425 RepID=A0AAN8YBF4_SOLBU